MIQCPTLVQFETAWDYLWIGTEMIVAHESFWGAESTAIADRLGGDATAVVWPEDPRVVVSGDQSGMFDPEDQDIV